MQELMNILWTFVQSRFVPQPLLSEIGDHLTRDHVAGALRGLDWASLVWSYASLGVPLEAYAVQALNKHGMESLVEMTPAELCNMLW